MTGREWQHALYVTDRWHVNNKLTLNLGLRFEMYPLMTRADSGIERLDLNTYEVLLGGLGNTPEDVGINVKKFYLAPRLGAIYRLGEKSVLRAGYGRTFNPLPWSRPMRGSYPFDIFFNQTAEQYGSFPIEDGHPAGAAARPEHRPGQAAAEHLHPHARSQRRRPRHHPADEHRLRAAAARRRLGRGRARAHPHRRRLRRPRHQPLRARRRATRDASTSPWPAPRRSTSGASRTKSRYRGLQLAVNRPFRNGLLLKGAYTLSRSENETANDEDGWAGLTWNHPDAAATATSPSPASTARTSSRWASCTSCRSPRARTACWAASSRTGRSTASAPRTPARRSRSPGRTPPLNCPGCGSRITHQRAAAIPRRPAPPARPPSPGTTVALLAADGRERRRLRQQPRATSSARPAVWNVDLGLFRSFPVGRVRPEIRIEATNVFNHTNWARPNLTFTSPQFMTFAAGRAHQFEPRPGAPRPVSGRCRSALRLEF